ncbi:MAG: hypothetical protein ACNA8W_00870 [Bradymonadaceae bacterium]
MDYNRRASHLWKLRGPSMRLFDIIGVLAVIAWVGVIGLFAFEHLGGSSTAIHLSGGEVVMHEGDTWMTLQRNDHEVGYVHEVRTRLPEGWLLEYTMLMTIDVLNMQQVVETQVKSTIDDNAVLRQFSAEITAMGQTFRTLGEATDEELRVTIYAGGRTPTRRNIPLSEPPRLSVNAIKEFLASPELEPGARIKQQFFDPTTMQMTTMDIEYVGPEDIKHLEVEYAAHRFHQHAAGQILETLVDERGEVLIQTFPMGILGWRIPAELARGQVAALNRKVRDDARGKGKAKKKDEPFNLGTALELLESLVPASSEDEDEGEEKIEEEKELEDPQPTTEDP